jgi:hypothetical protein
MPEIEKTPFHRPGLLVFLHCKIIMPPPGAWRSCRSFSFFRTRWLGINTTSRQRGGFFFNGNGAPPWWELDTRGIELST